MLNLVKKCTTCKEIKSLDLYSPDKRASDGKQGRCIECCRIAKRNKYYSDIDKSREKRRDYYDSNKEKISNSNKKYRDNNKELLNSNKKIYYEKIKHDAEWKSNRLEYRINNKEKKREYDAKYKEFNRDILNRKSKLWVKNNPDKRRSISKSYKHKRRSKEKQGASTKEIHEWEVSAIKICYWCDIDCSDSWHIDHYFPLSKGGRHEVENLVISCPKCNIRKSAKHPHEFAISIGRPELCRNIVNPKMLESLKIA